MIAAQNRMDTARPGIGIAMMLVAWGFFSIIDTSVKWLVLAGIPATQLAFVRYAGQFAVSCGLSRGRMPKTATLTRRQVGLLSIRGALLASATLFNFYALQFLPLPLTASIMFSSPIFVCILSMPLLGERVEPWSWFAIILGFLGVLIIIQPFGSSFHPASLIVVYNAIALALFSIITRKLAKEVSPQTMQFFMGGIGTLAMLPLAFLAWSAPQTTLDWVLLLALGAWAWCGHEIFTRAHAFAPASVLMPFSYSFILYLSLSTYLIWGDLPQGSTLLGAAIIVASGLIIWWRESHSGSKGTS